MKRIVIVEDQQLVCEGIKSLLELRPGYQVVATAEDGRAGLSVIRQHQPDIVLLDIRMPVMNGVELLQRLQQTALIATTPVLVLTTFDDHELLRDCIRLGAKGYLRKDVSLEELTKAIDCLVAGGEWLQPAITQRISRVLSGPAEVPGKPAEISATQACAALPLTQAEIKVLRLIAAGCSNQEIADVLHKAPGTIRNQVSAILDKLDARDRTQAVLKAIDQGVI